MPQSATAQLRAETPQNSARFEFNFSNPGARSLARGGAFAALADDATAAYANPAGLISMTRPEVSVEIRAWRYEVPFLQPRHVDPRVLVDRVDTVSQAEEVSFLSYVYPRKHVTFAIYRHQLANFAAQAGPFAFPDEENEVNRNPVLRSTVDLNVVGSGLMSAYLFEQYGISVGLGVVRYDSDFHASQLEDQSSRSEDGGLTRRTMEGLQLGHGVDYGVNIGIRWQPNHRWVAGAFYRQGFGFPLSEGSILVEGADRNVDEKKVGRFRVPPVYGIGIAIQPLRDFYLSVEYDRIPYSSVLEPRPRAFDKDDETFGRFRRDDADEFRLGGEYFVWKLQPALAIRLGAWYEPDHALRFDPWPGQESSAREMAALFPRGQDVVHMTGGLGLVLGPRLELNVAVDLSDVRDVGSLSGIFRF